MASSRVGELTLDRSIGFSGLVRSGLIVHPNGRHILHPLGSTIVIRELGVAKQHEYLHGHSFAVTCMAVSKCGRFIASGQQRGLATKADVIVWDFASRTVLHRLTLHKADIREVAFSPLGSYLVSLGGDVDNSIVVWDLARGDAMCGSPASMGSSGITNCLRFLHGSDTRFVSGGHQTLRVWTIDLRVRKLRAEECRLGQIKRVIETMVLDAADEVLYCGTTTGDVLAVNMATLLFASAGPKKPLPLGVTTATLCDAGLLVGSGEGKLALLHPESFKVLGLTELAGPITSIAIDGTGRYAFVGTGDANIYYVDLASFEAELRSSGHTGAVTDIAFPFGFSQVFATCGTGDIRVWNSGRSLELVRIVVPNVTCLCIAFSRDGGAIYSGWADGKIRAFGPETGRLLFAIASAHTEAVTAIAASNDGTRLISGGSDGQVRVWQLLRESQTMVAALKEHRGPVVSLQMAPNDRECLSASSDGSCIVWDLVRLIRGQVLFAPTLFKQAVMHPHEAQALTCGTDRKIGFWDAVDGTAIREVELEDSAHVNTLAMFADGERFASGGDDRVVQLWGYDAGEVVARSLRLSGNVVKVAVSPDQEEVVAVTDDGGVFVFAVPVASPLPGGAAEYF